MLAVRRMTSHSKGAGWDSSKSLTSKAASRSGAGRAWPYSPDDRRKYDHRDDRKAPDPAASNQHTLGGGPRLVAGLEIVDLHEVDADGGSCDGPKVWPLFDIVARRPPA